MAKQTDYTDFKFSCEEATMVRGTRVTITLTLAKESNFWKGYRHLIAMGTRLETLGKLRLDRAILAEVYPVDERKVTLNATTPAGLAEVEEALHSLYLWVEHPEKYA